MNDRLKVTVGSSFGLEGTQQANQQSNNIAGDVSIDYQLSKDGRYKIRGYRINKYQVALQGEVVETGISFIITLDYNKDKTLTAKKEKTIKKKSEEKKHKHIFSFFNIIHKLLQQYKIFGRRRNALYWRKN